MTRIPTRSSVLIAATVLFLTGCSAAAPEPESPAASEPASAAAEGPAESAEPDADAELGAETNPHPAGTTLEWADWQVTLESALLGDDATFRSWSDEPMIEPTNLRNIATEEEVADGAAVLYEVRATIAYAGSDPEASVGDILIGPADEHALMAIAEDGNAYVGDYDWDGEYDVTAGDTRQVYHFGYLTEEAATLGEIPFFASASVGDAGYQPQFVNVPLQ